MLLTSLHRGDARCRCTEIYVFLMLLVFPLFTGLHGYTSITAAKFRLLTVLTAAWLAALIVLTVRVRRRPAALCMAQWAALALLSAACLSALLSPYGSLCILGAGRYDGLVSTALYLAIFLGVSRFGSFRPYHAAAFGAAVVLCCTVALLQLWGYNPLRLFPGGLCYYDAHIKYTSEFLGTVGNVNLLSDILVLAAALFAVLAVTASRRAALWSLAPLGAAIFTLAASGVSGGAAALVFGALVGLPMLITGPLRLRRALAVLCVCCACSGCALCLAPDYDGGVLSVHLRAGTAARVLFAASAASFALMFPVQLLEKRQPGLRLRRAVCIFELAAVIAALALLWFWPGSSGTLHELSEVLHGRIDDSFGSSRIRIWRRALALAGERPLLGAGPGTISLRLDIEFSRFVPETGQTLSSFADNAHNVYLQCLADTGILGLACLLWLLFAAFRRFFKAPVTALRAGAMLAAVSGCAAGFFGLGLCLSAPLFWLFAGLMISGNDTINPPGGSNDNQ